MTTYSRIFAGSLLTVLGLAACEPQESTDYRGDPLWSMRGSLVGENGVASDTQVALLWSGEDVEVLQETEVEGNFPAEFTLRTYEAPPAKGLFSLAEFGADVRLGFGNIVAADQTAPLYPKLIGDDGFFDSLEGVTELELEPGESVVHDVELKWLRGGVPAYLVVYLEGEVPEDMRCLSSFAQGYNLVALRDYTESEWEQYDACNDRTFREALDAYNREHGTNFTEETLEDDVEAYRAVESASVRRYCEAGCPILKAHGTLVDTNERVTMKLEPDVEFVDWN